jgi:NADPH:quinone reductase
VRAATIEGSAVVVRDHPDPVPGRGELLVRVMAAGLNAADLVQRAGGYRAPPGSPSDIPGLELAGEVAAVGDGVFRFQAGDRVMAVVGGGAQAEMAVVHERTALPVPAGVGWPQAGGFAEVFTTAHDALFTQCGLASGERLLVHGAAGGVGVAAVQLGAVTGARVTATVRRAELREAVSALGAEVRSADDFEAGGPYDVVLELVGGPNMGSDLKALATGGRISVIGVGAGARVELDLLTLMARRARVHGSTLRARPLEEKATAAHRVEAHVLPLLAEGRIAVPVAATFPLEDVGEAYSRFEAGGKLGKIVLVNEATW